MGAVRVVEFRGDIDQATAPVVCQAVAEELLTGSRALVLDLTMVGFLGCAGLTVLVETAEQTRRYGSRLSLVSTRREVLRPLLATNLRDRFRIRPSLSRALQDFE